MFSSKAEADRCQCLMDGPWTFFKDMVVFQISTGFQKPIDMVFDEMPIWVQCHNVSLAFMHALIMRKIGSNIGRVLKYIQEKMGNVLVGMPESGSL